MTTKSVLLVGVGGQGTILASKLLTLGLMEAGYDVKMSEIHGMSQRGGTVSSQVRYGEKVFSPVIELGGADILVSNGIGVSLLPVRLGAAPQVIKIVFRTGRAGRKLSESAVSGYTWKNRKRGGKTDDRRRG